MTTRPRACFGLDINPGWIALPPAPPEDRPSRSRISRAADPDHLALAAHLAARLVEERRARGWSQQDLADRLGVDRTAVGRWERADRTIPLHRLVAASRLFGVPVEALLPAE